MRTEFGRDATAEDVADFRADSVIVATGARPWQQREIPGWDRPEVLDPFEILRGNVEPGKRVLVAGGCVVGCQVAMFLAERGRDVSLVAHGQSDLFADGEKEFAFDVVGEIVRPLLMERLESEVTLLPKLGIKRIEEGSVVVDLSGAFSPHLDSLRIGPVDEQRIDVDSVVLGVRRRPDDSLWEELARRGIEARLVGDAVEPRTVEQAVSEGSAAGRSTADRAVFATMPTAL